MPSIKYPNNTLLIKKVLSDNFIEDELEAGDIPIATSGTPYSDISVSGTNIQSAFEDICYAILNHTDPTWQDWQTWTPTYGGGGSMTFTSVTTTRARYLPIGGLVFGMIRFSGTTGGLLTVS